MAYQVLARKWRPKSFASLKGQEQITRALTNAIARGNLHHAYLFTGTRGVGKTTIARILAKALNCETGVTPTPCGQCNTCVAIDAGRFVDLIEVDAASRTRVEDTRELLENVQYSPVQGRYKIYLIDEVHMLSGHSFNALLKTLEEPPEHVIFILATTDPDRIPVTVLSRCLRFSLKALSVADILTQIEQILTSEAIAFEKGAGQIIAQLAAGSMRDALSLLEQAIAYCSGALKTQEVEDLFGLSYQRLLPMLMQAILAQEIKNGLQISAHMLELGADFEQVLASMLQTLHAIAIAQMVPSEQDDLAAFAMIDPALLELKNKITPEEVQLLYQIGLLGQRDLKFAPDQRTGFEMVLLRMIAFRPATAQQSAYNVPATVTATAPTTVIATAPASSPSPSPAPASAPPAPAVEQPVIAKGSQSQPQPVTINALEKEKVVQPSQNNQKEEVLDWAKIAAKLVLTGYSSALVKHCVISKWDGQQLLLTLDESQKAGLTPQREMQIQDALNQYFGRPIKVAIKVGQVKEATPSMQKAKEVNERQAQVKQAVEQDKTIQNILSTFEATVEKITTEN
ncbi:MAG: DNA polymerase III subunit gamma/tau [Candidatus Berkiellales bacterium]